MIDPTTTSIEASIGEREKLRSEVERLERALVASYTDVEVVKAECGRLRSLVEEACGELDDTGGEFACRQAAEIRKLAGIVADAEASP